MNSLSLSCECNIMINRVHACYVIISFKTCRCTIFYLCFCIYSVFWVRCLTVLFIRNIRIPIQMFRVLVDSRENVFKCLSSTEGVVRNRTSILHCTHIVKRESEGERNERACLKESEWERKNARERERCEHLA